MRLDFLLDVFHQHADDVGVIWRDQGYRYRWLLERFDHWSGRLRSEIPSGSVVVLEADFTPNAITLFLALAARGCILVPLTSSVETKKPEFIEIAQAEFAIRLDAEDRAEFRRLAHSAQHDFYGQLREREHPGLILFSSGSTGRSKAAVHDLSRIFDKFRVPRSRVRAITFLLFDHIGGVNTMLYQLANGGCIVTLDERSPDHVLSAIERHGVELLPASPTFLSLVLLSDALKRHDLKSLKTITYGTEPMPASTLTRLHALLPDVRLQQTYGLSELGILRSKSKGSDSLWVKVGGEGFETRVVDGILHIKAHSAMLGYLNAPSPFTEDGWFNTHDLVEQDGEYLRFLGRESEIINVGGEKVYPAEVESVILQMEAVREATVHGEQNPIVGNIPCVTLTLSDDVDEKQFVRELKRFCADRLPRYKVPVKVNFSKEGHHGRRFKKLRKQFSEPSTDAREE